DGRRVTSLALRLGGSLPLHAGAGPRSLLAFAPTADWDAYLSGDPLEQFTPETPTSSSDLKKELTATRRRGYALSDQDGTPGIAAIGAPIFDHREEVCASLSVSGIREAILGDDMEHVKSRVIEGALEISRSLGSHASAAHAA